MNLMHFSHSSQKTMPVSFLSELISNNEHNTLYKTIFRCHFTMTAENKSSPYENHKIQLVEEVCENIRAIRRVRKRILNHLIEYQTGVSGYNEPKEAPDEWSWDNLTNHDDTYL